DPHAHLSGRLEVDGDVVDVHALLGRQTQPVNGELEDAGVRLAEPNPVGDDDRVEAFLQVPGLIRVDRLAGPGVGQHADLDPVPPEFLARLEHGVLRLQV